VVSGIDAVQAAPHDASTSHMVTAIAAHASQGGRHRNNEGNGDYQHDQRQLSAHGNQALLAAQNQYLPCSLPP
jgi:hypothetical protein